MPVDIERLRRFRWARGLTQAQLASLAGISVTTYCAIEQGKRPARVTTLRQIATALGVEPEELLVVDEAAS